MPEAKPKRVRPRPGCVQVELTEADRKKLEAIRDRIEKETGAKVGLAGAFRSLLRRTK